LAEGERARVPEGGASRGLITNVQRFSIHDGPGIRTTVFLKGCPLRCFWCHNPETWRLQPELQLYGERCIGCGECRRVCPNGAHVLAEGRREFRRHLCRGCGACAETCYAEALVLAGRWWGMDELLGVLERDRPFYETSGGGITLSGGEPLLQPEFSRAVLAACWQRGLHTAIETAAVGPWERLEELLPWLDLVMLDVKLVAEQRHRAATGAGNSGILDNARRLGQSGVPLLVRTPIVPGVNDDPADIVAIAGSISAFPNLLYYELMPFHRLAEGKYRGLGLEYGAGGLQPPSRAKLQELAQAARDTGVADVRVG